MKTNAKLEMAPAPEWQRERLARWLHEWQIEQALHAVKQDDLVATERQAQTPVALGPGAEVVSPDDEPALARGQIRLLSPEISGADTVPVYVAVLDLGETEGPLAAPFSRFAEPGLPGELATGMPAAPLRVLCLWNARRLPSTTLCRSWLAAELPQPQLEAAATAYRCLIGNEPLPAELVSRSGPPLIHPDDPRHVYRARASMHMDRIAAAPVTYRSLDIGPRDLPLAAESGPEYDVEPNDRRDDPA